VGVAIGLLCFAATGSAQALNPCDLNGDGVVNQSDVSLAVSMTLGNTSCTANITGQGVCTVVTVQRVINAQGAGTCVTSASSHVVSINWAASASSNIAGYNIRRSTISGGPYTLVNAALITSLTFDDVSIQPGQPYYYVVTAVDNSGNESGYSAESTVTVPSP
jgi:hypothetical protein